jgi:V8-like Glu-specific endopeptidase
MADYTDQFDPTTLDTVISDQPWITSYVLGNGVDAITGQPRASAVKPFDVVSSPFRTEVDHRFVQSESDLKELMSATVKGSYNLEGVEVSAGMSFLQEVAVSDLAVTLVQWRKLEQVEFSLAPRYELTVTPDPDFRKKYGDYFVAGYRGGAQLFVMYQCRFKSAESRSKFSADLAANVPSVFSAEGSTAFEKITKKYESQVDIKISTTVSNKPLPPEPPGGWTPQNIIEVVVKWFNESFEMTKLEAYLEHYSLLDPTIPAEVPVSPQVFADIGLLYDRFWRARAQFCTCPNFGKRSVEEKYKKLAKEISAFQASLPYQPDTRQRLMRDTEQLLADLERINNRQSFYALVVAAVKTEPAQGQNFDADQGTVRWGYGFQAGNQPGVAVGNRNDPQALTGGFGYVKYTFDFRDSTKILVGWDVICNRTDGLGGDWQKESPQVMGRSEAKIWAKSDIFRDFNWSVTWYFVDASLYPPGPWAEDGIHDMGPVHFAPPPGEQEWTAERMAAAQPALRPSASPELLAELDAAKTQQDENRAQSRTEPYPLAPEVTVTTQVANTAVYPQRTVGRVFFRRDGKDFFGSASVVNRRGIVTAAHLFQWGQSHSSDVVFVPAYDNGRAPFGVWRVDNVLYSFRWPHRQEPALDVAFGTIGPVEGREIGNVVGWLQLETDVAPGPASTWNDMGYPCERTPSHNFNGETMWQSQGDFLGAVNGALSKGDQLSGGSSGGPWFTGGKPDQVSGVQSFGNNAYTISLSPHFGRWVKDMYDMIFA